MAVTALEVVLSGGRAIAEFRGGLGAMLTFAIMILIERSYRYELSPPLESEG